MWLMLIGSCLLPTQNNIQENDWKILLSTNFSSPFPADLISTHAQLDNNHLAPVTCYYIIPFTDKKLVQNKTTTFNE